MSRRQTKTIEAVANEVETVENTVENEVESQPEVSEQENSITVQDLFAATQIIDVATKRGAFSAAEAGGVGMTYTKITEFLKVAAPQLFEKSGGASE